MCLDRVSVSVSDIKNLIYIYSLSGTLYMYKMWEKNKIWFYVELKKIYNSDVKSKHPFPGYEMFDP